MELLYILGFGLDVRVKLQLNGDGHLVWVHVKGLLMRRLHLWRELGLLLVVWVEWRGWLLEIWLRETRLHFEVNRLANRNGKSLGVLWFVLEVLILVLILHLNN
jgi:hypothetical protein